MVYYQNNSFIKPSDPEIASNLTSQTYWENLNNCKIDFFNGVESKFSLNIRSEVLKSWRCSRTAGVSPTTPTKPYRVSEETLEKRKKENKVLYEVSSHLITAYEELAKSSGYTLEIFNAKGEYLIGYNLAYSDPEYPYRILGVDWCENKTGTMPHLLSMKYKKPYFLIGPEVVLERFVNSISFAAPILDDDKVIGSVLMVQSFPEKPWEHINPLLNNHSFGWVSSLAVAIGSQVSLLRRNRELNRVNQALHITLELVGEAVLTVDRTGKVLGSNSPGYNMLRIPKNLPLPNIKNYLPNKSLLMDFISSGSREKRDYFEQSLIIDNTEVEFFINIQPVFAMGKHSPEYYVLRFTPLKKIMNLLATKSDSLATFNFDKIIGKSPNFVYAKRKAQRFASTKENILLLGESGTGKELFAQAIHNQYNPTGPFIAVNCSAIPRELIESELFGYEKGAFTGAEKSGRIGKIELAHGGTLFLDEIGDMPYDLQTVLLRVLQNKRIMRVGGTKYYDVDFRLIAAANTDLLRKIKEKTFREDLFFRISVLFIEIPPLRERGEDILLLAHYFVCQYAKKNNMPVPDISPETEIELLSYSWPGNVRQLENHMIYAFNMMTGNTIRPEHLPNKIFNTDIKQYIESQSTSTDEHPQDDYGEIITLKELEKKHISLALERSGNRVEVAAKMLGISKSSLYRRLSKQNY